MRQIVMGNAGAGKTTLAHRLAQDDDAAVLCLDSVAFADSAERRALYDSVADALAFARDHVRWVIEGCYAELITPLLPMTDRLIFLNPGIDACLKHCRRRPWEPDKFESAQAQNEAMEQLLAWVRTYPTRQDEYGLKRHRQLFEQFPGLKVEATDPATFNAL